jgi:CheY-like chemotaxis protein
LVAGSGEEALGIVKEKKVDLVITDLAMPGMDGMKLVRHVKRDLPDLRTIILTAYGTPETVVEAQELGVDCFLSKPFDLSFLKARVDELLPVVTAPAVVLEKPPEVEKPRALDRVCFAGGRTLGRTVGLSRKTARGFHPWNVLFQLGRATGVVSRAATGFQRQPGNILYGLGRATGVVSGIPAACRKVR